MTPAPPAAVAGGGPAPAALVVFSGRADLWWLRLLKPGFRHCLLLLRAPGGWIVYDPMAHATALTLLADPPGTELVAGLLDQGVAAVPVRPRRPPARAAPWAPFTCVEAVKRALGIHARRVVTPWQLFRHLLEHEKSLDIGKKT